jgi:hypothetical protein
LQLLGEHPLTRVHKAVIECTHEHLISAEAVIQRTRSFATIEATTRASSPPLPETPGTARVQVPLPDLKCYDQFLSTPEIQDASKHETMYTQCCDTSAEGPVAVFFT